MTTCQLQPVTTQIWSKQEENLSKTAILVNLGHFLEKNGKNKDFGAN
jgi:hypothetical protein